MMKKKQNNNQKNSNLLDLYEQYNQIIEDPKFISFKRFYAEILLQNNIGFDSEIFQDFMAKINQALTEKKELVFKSFVIAFNLNLKFSQTTLVPYLTAKETSNTDSFNFKESPIPKLNDFLTDLSQEAFSLVKKGFYLEFLPKIVIFSSKETGFWKLLFDKSVTVEIN